MAQEDLIPFNELTEEEQKKLASKGGKASVAARRRKKSMREQAELLLSLAVKNPKMKKAMSDLGVEENEQTNQMAMIISMMNKAISKGDVAAFNSLQATIGEKPIEKVEADVTNNSSELKDILKQIKKE